MARLKLIIGARGRRIARRISRSELPFGLGLRINDWIYT